MERGQDHELAAIFSRSYDHEIHQISRANLIRAYLRDAMDRHICLASL